ncbi:MAG: DUF1289 domain-containing protein [Saccharospirillaceae bacterium]|nr:DUF1289 domain-containing protein [Pseudomonadales bacterium]NRB80496.1 DUF1289 domain-containing protein [Saccharospirillaceae bacterium]
MRQIEFFDIANPCKKICISGDKGLCIGCFRKREERLHWKELDDFTKKQIIRACAIREKKYNAGLSKKKKRPRGDDNQMDIFDESL